MLDRALEFMNDGADAGVILAQDVHDLFRLGSLGKSGKSAQVAKDHGDVAAVTVENAIVARRQDQLGHLRGQKPLQAVHAFDLLELLRHAVFERAIPAGEIGGLLAHLVRQLLDPQHRFDPRDQRALIDRLGQIFVGAGLEPGDDVLGVGFCRHQNDPP